MSVDVPQNTYVIEPVNEPNGEGNGWHLCDETAATFFMVYDDNGEVDGFDTRAEADACVADYQKSTSA